MWFLNLFTSYHGVVNDQHVILNFRLYPSNFDIGCSWFLKKIQGTWIPKFITTHIRYTTSGFWFLSQRKKCGM